MSNHTPEPWTADNGDGEDWGIFPKAHDDREAIAYLTEPGSYSPLRPEQAEANARRIVACVNACKGVPTEALEAAQYLFFSDLSMGEDAHVTLTKWNAALRQQVADLRAALEANLEGLESAARIFALMEHQGMLEKADTFGNSRSDAAIAQARRVLAATQPQSGEQ